MISGIISTSSSLSSLREHDKTGFFSTALFEQIDSAIKNEILIIGGAKRSEITPMKSADWVPKLQELYAGRF